jgi:hypothetical protein
LHLLIVTAVVSTILRWRKLIFVIGTAAIVVSARVARQFVGRTHVTRQRLCLVSAAHAQRTPLMIAQCAR